MRTDDATATRAACSRRQFASLRRRGRRGLPADRAAARSACVEMPKERLQARRSRELERAVLGESYGTAVTVADTPPLPGRPVRLRARPLPLHRLPPLRLRLRRGEQPVARPAGPLDPRAARWRRRRASTSSTPNPYYDPAEVPEEGHFYVPVACQQCGTRPASKVCPIGRHLDGAGRHRRHRLRLVHRVPLLHGRVPLRRAPLQLGGAVDLPKAELNPNTHYLGNRPRPKGVVEKCTFCIQRARAGRYPACVEVCPVGARKFGNLLDPESEIRYIIEHKRVLVLKEDLNTVPKFFYFYAT